MQSVTPPNLDAEPSEPNIAIEKPPTALCAELALDRTVAANSSRYKLRSAKDMLNLPPISYCVQDVLPTKGFACMFGAPSTGKSFLALALASSITNGTPFFGRKTEQRPVVFIALEGANSLHNRIAAIQFQTGQPMSTRLSFISQSFDALDPYEVVELGQVLPPNAVVIIDTLNQAAPSADENSSKDMSRIILAAKKLQQACDGLVIFVHHPGKDEGKGPRGHSALFAALDTAIHVAKGEAAHVWTIAKSKDGECGERFSFRLKQIPVPSEENGHPISSTVVEEIGFPKEYVENLTGTVQKKSLEVISNAIESSPEFPSCSNGRPSISSNNAETLLRVELGSSCKSPSRAQELIADLIEKGRLNERPEGNQRWLWLT